MKKVLLSTKSVCKKKPQMLSTEDSMYEKHNFRICMLVLIEYLCFKIMLIVLGDIYSSF